MVLWGTNTEYPVTVKILFCQRETTNHNMVDPTPLLVRVDVSNQRTARYCAFFDDGAQVHFGRKSQEYYTNGHYDTRRRLEFLYRHKEDTYDDPVDPRTLERWLLWECNHLDQAVARRQVADPQDRVLRGMGGVHERFFPR